MEKEKSSLSSTLFNGFFKENPVLVLQIGLCSTLAMTTNLDNAVGMGICVIFVLTFANIIVSFMRNIIPDEIRLPVYIIVIASLVSIVDMVLHAYVPSLYDAMGSFLGLIVVNCIILGRVEAFAAKNNPLLSMMDGLGMGIGYMLVLIVITFFRQLLGTGVLSLKNPISLVEIFNIRIIPESFTISTFTTPVGAFITFAIVIAAANYLADKSKKKGAKK